MVNNDRIRNMHILNWDQILYQKQVGGLGIQIFSNTDTDISNK